MTRLAATIVGLLIGLSCARAEEQEKPADHKNVFDLEPKYFQPTAEGTQGGLGFSYNIDYNLARPYAAGDGTQYRTLSLDFTAEGNVAFNSSINPSDFLKTGVDFNYELAYASAQRVSPDCFPLPQDDAKLQQCLDEARRSKTGSALHLWLGLIGTLESDQKFDKRQGTYGGQFTIRYRPADASLANTLNPLDWPFLLLRRASGHERTTASPDAFPTIRLALERVNPAKDPDREAILGNKEDYNRGNFELAMSTPAAKLQGKQVKFEWSWRYFKELSPDPAIRAAGLDRFQYSALSLRLDAGWRLTYARGRLPLDRQSDKVWELGYQVSFK